MIAVLLIGGPIVLYLVWALLRAGHDDEPTIAHPPPYSWGSDEELFEWLVAHKGLGGTLHEIRGLDTTEEPVR